MARTHSLTPTFPGRWGLYMLSNIKHSDHKSMRYGWRNLATFWQMYAFRHCKTQPSKLDFMKTAQSAQLNHPIEYSGRGVIPFSKSVTNRHPKGVPKATLAVRRINSSSRTTPTCPLNIRTYYSARTAYRHLGPAQIAADGVISVRRLSDPDGFGANVLPAHGVPES